jgi:hypothetical protein
MTNRPRFIVNARVEAGDLCAQVDLGERIDGVGGRGASAYAPVLFVRSEKVTRLDKLLLAFNTLVLSAVGGVLSPVAKVVHGSGQKVLRVKIEPLVGEARKVVEAIQAARAAGRAPVVTLNQKRLLKYRDRLFVFLDHDGVPWNNNNAENAIKRFAARRKIVGASFTEKGLRDYLVFLSIYQTCRLKGLGFLHFLRSCLLDIDAFAVGRTSSTRAGHGSPSGCSPG